jgi:hypothetical protein
MGDMMKLFMWACVSFIALVFIVLLGSFLAPVMGEEDPVPERALITDKYYTPGETSVGTGVSSSGNVVTTTSTTMDEYTLFINGESTSVNEKIWANVNEGDEVDIYYYSWLFYRDISRMEIAE